MRNVLLVLFLLGVACIYTASAQTTTARTVLVEKHTGTWCTYCPDGDVKLEATLQNVPESKAIAFHSGSPSEPMKTAEGDTLANTYWPISGWPSAAIDRVFWTYAPGQSAFFLNRGYWEAIAGYRASQPSQVSITVTGTYDSISRIMTATVTLNVLDSLKNNVVLHVALTEYDLNYQQWNGSQWLSPYYHKHVVRKLVTGVNGLLLTSAGFAPGATPQAQVTFQIPSGWNVDKMKFTAFVTGIATGTYGGNPKSWHAPVHQTYQSSQPSLRSTFNFTPVELAAFAAEQQGAAVRLFWRTASETDNSGWHVERRTDQSEWTSLGFVAGSGTTTQEKHYEFFDNALSIGYGYSYRLKQVDFDGKVNYSAAYKVNMDAAPVSERLGQNYPNPFAYVTEIPVELTQDADVTLEVYDGLGRKVADLASGRQKAGISRYMWDSRDLSGAPVAEGMYFARLTTANGVFTSRMIVAR